MPSLSRAFRYGTAYVRARVRHGEVVWFTRDVAAALGIHRIPARPLLPASPAALPGMATTAQVWTLVELAGCGAPDAFRAWMANVSTQLAEQPQQRPGAPGPRPRQTPGPRSAPWTAASRPTTRPASSGSADTRFAGSSTRTA
ncbi:hypothetical protein ACIQ9R_36115 [Streptomyces sp. NPDC094447]|uniref:hypothetical protein n=1 Tax=Streptomyces sp. NPDC094447 TaxID=3366062 RepID=UPI0037FC36D8